MTAFGMSLMYPLRSKLSVKIFNKHFKQQQNKCVSLVSYSRNKRFFDTQAEVKELPPPAKFIKLSEGTTEDFKAAQEHFSRVASTENTVDKWLNMIEASDTSTLLRLFIGVRYYKYEILQAPPTLPRMIFLGLGRGQYRKFS